jgi:hypothetical protein
VLVRLSIMADAAGFAGVRVTPLSCLAAAVVRLAAVGRAAGFVVGALPALGWVTGFAVEPLSAVARAAGFAVDALPPLGWTAGFVVDALPAAGAAKRPFGSRTGARPAARLDAPAAPAVVTGDSPALSDEDSGRATVRRAITAVVAAREAAAARTAAPLAVALVASSAVLSGAAATAASTVKAERSESGAAGFWEARWEVAVVWSRSVRSPAAVRGPAEPFVAFAIT